MTIQIVEPYAKMIGPIKPTDPFTKEDGINLLRRIEYFGRISHRSEEAQTEDSWERFIRSVVLGHGDWSIVEHANVTVEAVVDRGISHEWVRHRLGAYTQSSTRFINHVKKMPPTFIEPPGLTPGQQMTWTGFIIECEDTYKSLIASGQPPEIARSVFPNALSTKLIVTYNLRMWRSFFLARTTKEAHRQMRQVTIPLLEEFKEKMPLLFNDILPNSRQSDNLRLPR